MRHNICTLGHQQSGPTTSLIVRYEVGKGLGAVYLNLEPEREGELRKEKERREHRKILVCEGERERRKAKRITDKHLRCKSPLWRRTRAKYRFLSLCWPSIPFEKRIIGVHTNSIFTRDFASTLRKSFTKKMQRFSDCSSPKITSFKKLILSDAE